MLTHSISSVDDTDYNGLAAVELTVNVLETRNIVLNPATALSLTEGGAASSYTVKLSHQPTATVTVAVASANADLEFSIADGDKLTPRREVAVLHRRRRRQLGHRPRPCMSGPRTDDDGRMTKRPLLPTRPTAATAPSAAGR